MTVETIIQNISKSSLLNEQDANKLLNQNLTRYELMTLSAAAVELTEKAFGSRVEFCAIINARSGTCTEDCVFCAQSARYKTDSPGYKLLDHERVINAAKAAKKGGAIRFSIVTSGKAAGGDELGRICRMVEAVADMGLKPCASLGCLKPEAMRQLKSAGLDRFHHNLEASESYYPHICTTHPYAERVETIKAAQEAGLTVCSGGIFGLGESKAQRVEMIQALRDLHVDSIAVNFLNPIPGTPLENNRMLEPWEALTTLAVIRLMNPVVEIRTCGGRIQTLGELSALQYLFGANATMTGDYLTTSGPNPEKDISEIKRLGLKLISVE